MKKGGEIMKGNKNCLHCNIHELIVEHCTRMKALHPDLSFDEFNEEVMKDLGQVAGDIVRYSKEHGCGDEEGLRKTFNEWSHKK
jgi:hypothetical protein